MSNLSWLNPTPHAIAVYASHPFRQWPRNTRYQGSLHLTWAGLSPAGSHQLRPWRTHSITSSARASSIGGTLRPSNLAVWALTTISNLLDCTTGKSEALEKCAQLIRESVKRCAVEEPDHRHPRLPRPRGTRPNDSPRRREE